tara:strand:- start:295 stop:585 length:291 start_codon:yes stop_codon:yes gene_type:complete
MDWTIAQLERTTATGGVTIAHWRVSKTDGEYSASSYGTCGFEPDEAAEDFVAFEDLTEEVVLGWVQATMDVEALEAGFDAQLEALAAPTTLAGTPW